MEIIWQETYGHGILYITGDKKDYLVFLLHTLVRYAEKSFKV